MRLRIVQALVGRRLTTQQLKDELSDVPQASLYRHVSRLVDAGILRVTDQRAVRGGLERTYAVIDSAAELGPAAFVSATTDDHLRYFATFLGSLITGFERHLRSVGSNPAPGPDSYSLRADPAVVDRRRAHCGGRRMDCAPRTAPAKQPGGERRRRLLSLTLFPDASANTSGQPAGPSEPCSTISDLRLTCTSRVRHCRVAGAWGRRG